MEDSSITPTFYASEDSVQCSFYSSSLELDVTYWERLCDSINKTIVTLSQGHIWHRDEFRVYFPLHDSSTTDIPLHLESSTCFADNIEDEWFIVYIVMEISRQFKNLIIQLKDNDGEFLLIEAADYLQPWVNPNNTENRVYIYMSLVHFIPETIIDSSTNVNVIDAIEAITNHCDQTRASSEINKSILNRISVYPEKIKNNLHRAVVTLPVDIAALLILKPCLISAIVNAYCSHDMIDAQTCKNLKFDDCVTTEITFTKCLYAMLIHSKLINNIKLIGVANNDKKLLLGFKLTCGYEMLTSNILNDIYSSKEYSSFLNNLKKNGYFKDNLEGSKHYKDLLDKAKKYYKCTECPINSYLSSEIMQIKSTRNYLDVKETLKHSIKTQYTEDNEDWLNINPEQLNELLHSRYGKQSTFKSSDLVTSQTITSKLTDFLEQTSGFEGIEQINVIENNQVVDFDPDGFVTSIEKMLNILSTDNVNNNEDSDDCDFTDDSDHILSDEIKQKNDNSKEINNTEGKVENKTVINNIIKSMKEEGSSPGPSSNLLWTVGLHKMDLINSDD
ncbi:protein ecdysoneless homolog [Achroia grisella]|uniref:protein ecdysoneless homolog n=1 Tax=Achroia grisella TaxID=688607 RepID=UPI0027D2300C|nr:protein ecdysoneless homolog [Achroia grisella]